jgi:methylmalonyl-CoA mutase N-terminal domain/subunit
VDDGKRTIVGVNAYAEADVHQPQVLRVDPERERAQVERVRALRAARDGAAVTARLEDLRAAARSTHNLLPSMKEALRAHATLGEVSDALRDVFGVHRPG